VALVLGTAPGGRTLSFDDLSAMAVSADQGATPSAGRRSPEEKLVTSLIALMEAGTTPWRRPWDDSSGGHHVNLLSGRRYRGSNPALLSFGMHLRGSTLPFWCGFAEARARGLVPRRGSQAVHVLRPQVIQTRDAGAQSGSSSGPATPDAALEASEHRQADGSSAGPCRVLYRPVPVFNAADLEGAALAELVRARRGKAARERRPEQERLLSAEAVLQRWPVPVISGGERACYDPDADRIHLPEHGAFHSAAAHVATWAHEAIHSTGHPSRLARDLSGVMGAGEKHGRAYAREELVAELGAVLLGERLEIGSDTQNHAAYLSHWIAMLRESPHLLLTLLSQARKAADLICPEPPPGANTPAGAEGATATDEEGSVEEGADER
jgi:antirestriction protein ArdC